MNPYRNRTSPAIMAAACILLFSITFTMTGFAQVLSPASDECDWPCKNLKQLWNYLFHPERVNQCQPRGLEIDKNLEELTMRAFTRDDPSIPHYCGDPFSTKE